MPKFERTLRLATGLAIAAYVAGHFLNHALGIVSVEAMDALRRPLAAWPDSSPELSGWHDETTTSCPPPEAASADHGMRGSKGTDNPYIR